MRTYKEEVSRFAADVFFVDRKTTLELLNHWKGIDTRNEEKDRWKIHFSLYKVDSGERKELIKMF
ncbi:hypothetical protein H5410_050149 [Solanum commersonii]|uniref:Uncharacterized protein n=1 Tax=Solanum commersonii TaxID=4109 RepID=A0A9J5WUQ9_SOLCO|nr:hypothetical protein H5410_050149 [Solanum commersonii]